MKLPASLQPNKSIQPARRARRTIGGFTVVEVLGVISIIGILSIIGVVSFSRLQSSARDSQRSSKITVIAEALEKYYSKYGEYPDCAALQAAPTTVTTSTLKGLDPDALTTPSGAKGDNSFDCGSLNSSSLDRFAYTVGTNGYTYTLQYKQEGSGNIISISSRKHDPTPQRTLVIIAGIGGTVNSGGTFDLDSTQTITATPSTYYSFTSWTGAGCDGVASHTITMDADKTCTANFTAIPISAPATPTVVANTVGATTTWSWGAASCPGNSVRYHYRLTISPSGFDSDVPTPTDPITATSVSVTTSIEAQTYTVEVQVQCYNAVTSSSWSGSDSESYYRPIVNYTLTINAGAGGTVNSGGTYASGSTPTITATPSTYYSFSSWTGDTGCAGIASHTITMDADKTCTANFTATAISAPSAPTVTANTVGATTTWSWGAASCPGNTARYQYRYTFAPAGYDSGWVGTASIPVGFTTSTEGQTYTVEVQAQCYNTATSSIWSGSGSDSYFRPVVINYTLTISAGTNGTVNTAVNGSYTSGSTPTVTATPNANYAFTSWTGDTGCSGIASHTITMDANKTCTANFIPTPISAPSNPVVAANTVGATTTWSWGAASCPGNTARYQYRYTITPSGYDSGWVARVSPSIGFTTSTEVQTYTVEAQAQCYNAVTSSSWSGSGSDSYYRAYSGVVTTLAGSTSGYQDGTCAAARFAGAGDIAIDSAGNFYVADTGNYRIRKITPACAVTTLAGSGVSGNADGTGAAAQFNTLRGITVDSAGNVYVADNLRIRKITPAGVVTTLAGSTMGYLDGTGAAAKFNSLDDIAVDSAGNLYVPDLTNQRIRKITPAGVVTTLAGTGEWGFADDDIFPPAKFFNPAGVAVDSAGNVYVADNQNKRIRKITPAGFVTTLAGEANSGTLDGTCATARFNVPGDIAIDSAGNLYVADTVNTRIRKITPTPTCVVTTLAGTTSGYLDGPAATAKFSLSGPAGLAVDSAGNVYAADGNRIRKIQQP